MSNDSIEKSFLQQQIENKRNNISSAITDIKTDVQTEVEDRREAVKQVFDWRYQVKNNPAITCGVALAVGYFVGKKIPQTVLRKKTVHEKFNDISDETHRQARVLQAKTGLFGNAVTGLTDLLMRETLKTAQSMIVPIIVGAISGKISGEAVKEKVEEENPEILSTPPVIHDNGYGTEIL